MATYTFEQLMRNAGVDPNNPEQVQSWKSSWVSNGVNTPPATSVTSEASKPKVSYFQDAKQDIKETGQAIKESFIKRRSEADATKSAAKGKEQNGLRTAFQAVGQGAGLVSDVIEEGVMGIGKAILPQKAEDAIGGAVKKVGEKIADTDVVKNLAQRYQEIKETDPAKARDIDAALGIASLGLDVAGAPVAKAGVKVAGKTAIKGAATAIDVGTGAKNLVTRGTSEISGAMTGLNRGGEKALKESIQAGGESADLARKAMRGKITAEETQKVAREATEKLISEKNKAYQSSLETLKDNKKSYDVSPILKKLDEELDSFGVKKTSNGSLDFSSSPLRFNSEAKKDIQSIFDEMKDFGLKEGDRNVIGLDSLKRAFGDLYSPSGEARKFVSSMSSEVRKVLNQVPGYQEMSEGYAKSTELIKDIQKNLSLGTRTGNDTAYQKLSQVLRKDTDARKQLLQELNNASEGKLIPMLSGTLANPVLPRGLTRPLSGLFAGGAGISSGGSMIAALKALLVTGAVTSPRLAGEIINILNLPRKLIKPVQEYLDSFIEKESLVKPVKKATKKIKEVIKKK